MLLDRLRRISLPRTWRRLLRRRNGRAPKAPLSDHAEENKRLSTLPAEVWLEIIHHVQDPQTLGRLSQVNQAFQQESERVLYHTVTLELDFVFINFSEAVISCPRRALIIRALHIRYLEGWDNCVAKYLSQLLRVITRVEQLTIILFSRNVPYPDFHYQQAFDGCHLTLLRSLTTNVCGSFMSEFYARHPDLEHLEITHDLNFGQLTKMDLPNLRSLACPPDLLRDGFYTTPQRLTHLKFHLLYQSIEVLFDPRHAALCARLVSLRLRVSWPSHPAFGVPRLYTLGEFVALFPHLRFLQVDTLHKVKPYLNEQVIEWSANRRTPTPSRSLSDRVTVVWTYDHHPELAGISAVDLQEMAVWHQYLNDAALKVLHEWQDCVGRIVYRHTIIPYVSVTLSEDGERLVRKQDREMSDDYWKSIE